MVAFRYFKNNLKISSELMIALFLSAIIFVILVLGLRGWVYDDPYITYRYAENIAAGNGFVYNLGEKVLSTTTPLFALLLALFKNPIFSTHAVANIIGSMSLAASGLLLWLILKNHGTTFAHWVGLLVFPFFPTVFKTISSETPLYIMVGLLAIYLYYKKRFDWSAFFAGIVVMIRPDGLLVPGLLFLFYLFQYKRIPYRFSMIVLLVNLPWILFAWIYFGVPIPVTLSVKQNQGAMEISQLFAPGFLDLLKQYLTRPVYWFFGFLFILGTFYIVAYKKMTEQIVSFWVILYFLAYTILGVSRYYWYYAPVFSLITVLIGYGLEWLTKFNNFKIQKLTAYFLIVFLFGFQLYIFQVGASQLDSRIPAYTEIGIWLNQNTNTDETIGLLEVGVIGYYADRTMIDFAGLIKPDVAKQMKAETTYQDTSIWAIDHYHPDYLVLHSGFLPDQLMKDSYNCDLVKHFDGVNYGFTTMEIYKCTW